MKQRDKEERRVREGEIKRTMRKEGGRKSARLAPSLFSTSAAPYPAKNMDKSSHFELKQGALGKNVSIRVAPYVPSSLRTNLQYSPRGTQELIIL